MNSTRKQRRDFIKQIKKSNPNISKAELDDLKKKMAELGKEQHLELQTQMLEQRGGRVLDTESDQLLDVSDLDDELVDDFAPEDLDE